MDVLLQVLAFLICSALGYIKAYDYTCRVNNLKSFIFVLKYLEDEIIYRKSTLPDAITTISQHKASNAAKFFLEQVAYNMNKDTEFLDLYEVWKDSVTSLKSKTYMEDKDIEVILELGKSLGNSDTIGQQLLFTRIGKMLNDFLQEAQEMSATKGKMYKGLGIAAGLILVILLV